MGNKSPDKKVELCAMSIIGQCLISAMPGLLFFRLRHKEGYTDKDIKEITKHIINFSLKRIG